MPATEAQLLATPQEDLALIREAAAQAGLIALKYFKRDPEVWMKSGNSPVSEADYAVDSYLKTTLMAARPHYGWLSEETVDSAQRLSALRTFVVDPIDGTRAFLDGRPIWCVSVAVVEDGVTIAGVLDCPAKSEIFWAVAGGGSYQDGTRLAVVAARETPAVAGPKNLLDAVPEPLRHTLKSVSYVPSLAYRVAMVANGVLDASFIKPNAHDWDLAAADLILREAGGRILDHTGKSPEYARADPRLGALAAGSGALLSAFAAVILESAI